MSQRPIEDSDYLGSPRRPVWNALACVVILTAGFAAWSNSFGGPFLFDDLTAIRENPTLRHFPAWENLAPPQVSPVCRRPVVNLTLALTFAISGLDVRGFHTWNLLIHLLASLALFGIVRRTLLTPPLKESFGRAAPALAFAAALIWTVHPLQTESVTYLTQRTESLMGLFYLLTLYAAVRGASSGHPWRWHAAAVAACALGMGSKEVMASAPVVVLLYDRCFLSGSFREALRRRWPLYLGLAATWAILGALLIAYPWGGATGAGFGLAAVGPWEYARTQPGVILHYLRLSFWPSSLCLDYAWPIAVSAWQIIPAAAVIAALLAGTIWALRRTPALGFLGAWFFLILAPSSSFVPIIKEVAAERRMYLPLAALVMACVVAAYWLGGTLIRRVAESAETRKRLGGVLATAALLAVTPALGYRTFERNELYLSAISIWQDTAAKRPLNSGAQNNLGTAYLKAGHLDEAIRCFSKAIELKPDFFEAYNNRAAAYTVADRIEEAIADFNEALTLKPDSAAAYGGRAAAYIHLRRYDLAVADCAKAISLQPDLASAYNTRGVAYAKSNRLTEAMQDYDKAILLDPDYAEAYSNRGAAEAGANRLAEAVEDCTQAIKLQPGYVEALENRSNAYLRLGQYPLAIADCDQVIALRPDRPLAYINRAAAYSQIGQYEQALADVQTFREMGGKPPADFVKALLRAAGRSK